ncbi:MAG: LamG-like jellyroll fold domain-containing protein [Bacteroidaceae bacterium]
MNSAISSDGGTTFNEYAWGRRMSGYYPIIDGTDIDQLTYNSNLETVSCARHNADNHCIVSHKSGRVFRGSDGGMLMRDPTINGGDWVNISGNMGQMLYYHMGVNEFGDQVMCSNTQDVDVQTYRYGRWGDYRGYEGSTVFIGPYGGTCYYPSGGSGIAGQSYSSWIPGWTAANVCTGNWFLRRGGAIEGFNFYIIKDFGGTSIPINLPGNKTVDAFALARDTERGTLYVRLNNKKLYKSLNEGETFEEIATVGDASIAVNPNNSQELYYANDIAGIKKSTNGGRSWSDITYNQTKMAAHNLYYHEGSGDLYLINANNGIFILKAGTTTWELWMKGYNPAAFSNAIINYTTQEMVLYDYGRGAYVADLEHPSDRYFKVGFKLKELSHINNKRTIGIDTRWTIPLFYNYEWTINGVKIDNPYQYLVSDKLKMGDKVQLKLTMRESPDVTTLSEEFTIAQTTQEIYTPQKGYALSGSGRIDLGHVDYFHNDFTIDLWANVETNGVLLANRQKEERGAKGWYVEVLNGKLSFLYAPANMFNNPKDEEGSAQAATLSADFPMKVWNHIAITHERNGNVKIYINGILKDTQKRILPEHTLNNSIYLSLFSDGFEKEILNASADELKIWNKALSPKDIRKSMYTTEPITNAQLVYHNDFNSGKLETQKERFSKQGMQSRIKAKVQFNVNPIPIVATYVAYDTLSLSGKEWANSGVKLLNIKAKDNEYKPSITVCGYLNAVVKDGSEKLNEKYHQIAPLSYLLQTFDVADTDKDTIDIHFFMEDAQSYSGARLYVLNPNDRKAVWTYYADLKYNKGDKFLSLQNVRASELNGIQLAIVKMKPGIELSINNIDKTGYLNLYHNGSQTLQIQAMLQGNITEPSKGYKVMSNNKFAKISTPFYFTKKEATSNIVINSDSLGVFGDIHTVTLTGEDDKMIPFTFDIVNKITPKEAGNAILFNKGGALVGNSIDYASINLSNTITLMGWVKIDSLEILSGIKPLLFFRGGGSSFGIHLDSGNIRCHWNEESWSWNQSTPLTIKPTDIGRWMHVALVSTPTSISYYLNGQRYTVNRDMNGTRVFSSLMLGKNTMEDNSFKGCFDQVSVWNRSLSDDEILKYMHQKVVLDSKGLVSYVDMDYHDSSNIMRDRVTNSPINFTGTHTKYPSQIPYNMVGQIKRNATENPDTIGYPKLLTTTLGGNYYTTRFYTYPANYFNSNFAMDKPLVKSFWVLTYNNPQAITLGEQTSILFNDPAILSGDSLVMAIRPLGSLEVFQKRIGTKSTKNGEAIFKLPSNDIAAPCELMLFAAPNSSKRPVKVNLSAETENGNIILKDIDEYTLVKVTSISGNEDDTILLTVKEPYASLKKDTICFSPEGYSMHTLYIDKTKINAFANNPVTISAIGAGANALTLNVSLEPKVSIKLKNGDSDTHIIATSTIANLEIETKLEQGVFTDKILLDIVADMDYSSSINGGEILSNNDVKSGVLDYFRSSQGESEEGWNLVANPYLANVNLTKEENITGKGITRFIYRYDEKLHNYLTNDRMNYEAEQTLSPLQPYFVQATETNANVTIHPFAKELTLSKKNINFITPKERTEFRIDLYAKGTKADRTDIILEAGSQAGFIINEDAPKLWSLDNSVSQLYSLIGNKAYSINAMPTDQKEIKIGFIAGTTGEYSLKFSNIKGIKNDDKIILQDKANNNYEWTLNPESAYNFSVNTIGKIEDRFVLKIEKSTTDIKNESTCRIYVDNKVCYIESLPFGSSVHFYNVQGHLLFSEQPKDPNYSVSLNNGVYLISIITNGKETTAKISVR